MEFSRADSKSGSFTANEKESLSIQNISGKKYESFGEIPIIYHEKEVVIDINSDCICWTKVTSNKKEPSVSVPFSDIVGVEVHPRKRSCFVLYSFPKYKDKRERKVYSFITRDDSLARYWIQAIKSALRGVPVGTPIPPFKLMVLVNPAGGSQKSSSDLEKRSNYV